MPKGIANCGATHAFQVAIPDVIAGVSQERSSAEEVAMRAATATLGVKMFVLLWHCSLCGPWFLIKQRISTKIDPNNYSRTSKQPSMKLCLYRG